MRTDLEIVQIPDPLPNWGGLLGKNIIFTDPDFGTQIVRLTDGSDSDLKVFQVGTNAWNKNDTMIKVTSPGGKVLVFQFNPKKMQRLPDPVAILTNGKCAFSTVYPGVLYELDGLIVKKLSFTKVAGVWQLNPLPSIVCDFAKILPAGFDASWVGTFDLSEGDKTFCLGVSEGVQNSAIYGCVWQRGWGVGKGYRLLNTRDGIITGDWGENGPISITSPDTTVPFTIHEISQTPNPRFVSVGAFGGGASPLIWDLPTLNLVDSVITGHRAKGYLHSYAGGPGGGEFGVVAYMQSWGLTGTPEHQLLIPKEKLPASLGQVYDGDIHGNFGLISKTDESIFWIVGQTDQTPFTSAWMNEVRGYDVVNAIVYRACHTFNTGKSKFFAAANALPNASQTGKFVAWCTDGMETLGAQANGDPRADVFVARLIVP
jgi:hypothetical protein